MGHFYDKDGQPHHTIIGKNKKERPTTIRDARANQWYPSVTTILQSLAAPELDIWKQKQVLLAALTLPRVDGEDEDTWVKRIREDAFKQVDDAADLGTAIHKALELYFQGRPYDTTLDKYINPVKDWASKNNVQFIEHEVTVVNPQEGYAGTTDGVISVLGRDGVGLIDFKSRKTKPEYEITPWSKEPTQLSAYAKVRGAKFACNLYISTTEVGRIGEAWYDEDRLSKEYECFTHVCKVWRHFNNYVLP